MPTTKVCDGNHAAAQAMKQINPDVVAAYPITPTSYIMETFSKYVNNGEVDTQMITTESEHAAMSACVGASAAGGRVITATASQGLALMHEVLFNASGMRLPIILINGNRALGAPLSIHCDHSDSMAQRDTGFIQIYAKNAQEMYDLLLQSLLISEHEDVRTPIMINMDAFQVTHTHQSITIEDTSSVQEFIGEPALKNPLLDLNNPVSYGGAMRPDFYQEARRGQLEGMLNSANVILETGEKFMNTFGRDYASHVETFELHDAESVIVVMGSTFGTIQNTIRQMRSEGQKVGALRIRTFRPFPIDDIRSLLENKKQVAVLDRTSPAGAASGPVFMEIASTLYSCAKRPKLMPFVYGLGSRELSDIHIREIFDALRGDESTENIQLSDWVNLRG